MMERKQVSDFSVLILSLIIIIINEPYLSRIVQGAGILALMAFFVLLNINRFIQKGVLKNDTLLLATLYVLFLLAYELLGISNSTLISYYYTISFLFFAVIVTPIITLLTKKQQNILLAAVIVSVIVMMLTNIRLSNQYGAYYVRLVDYYTGRTNAINTQYVSALILFCGVILTKIRASKKGNAIAIALLIFSVYFVVAIGQRLTAILLLFAVIMMQLIFSGKKTLLKYVGYVAAIVIGITLILNYDPILRWASATLNNERVTRRINQLLYALNAGEIEGAGGSLEVRFRLVLNSWHTFTSGFLKFLLGAGEHSAENDIIGHHSQWIDELAKYGIVGLVLLLATVKRCFKNLRNNLVLSKESPLFPHYIIMISYFILRGLIGNVLYPYFGIMFFVFMPIVYMRISPDKTIGGIL